LRLSDMESDVIHGCDGDAYLAWARFPPARSGSRVGRYRAPSVTFMFFA